MHGCHVWRASPAFIMKVLQISYKVFSALQRPAYSNVNISLYKSACQPPLFCQQWCELSIYLMCLFPDGLLNYFSSPVLALSLLPSLTLLQEFLSLFAMSLLLPLYFCWFLPQWWHLYSFLLQFLFFL